MIDLKDVLQSKEMRDVVDALSALKQKYLQDRYEPDRPWPIALTLRGRYKPDAVLAILLDGKNYYPGYKEILGASFAGWLLAPHSQPLREALVVQAVLLHMHDAERISNAKSETLTEEVDIAARYIFTGIEFLIEIYDCLGGYGKFYEMPSYEEVWAALYTTEKTIRTAVQAIAFLHHAVDRFSSSPGGFVPSLNKAVMIFEELKNPKRGYPFKDSYVSRSLLHEHWSRNKQTLALLYAASSIRFNRTTLLDQILAGSFSFKRDRERLERCISRARYVVKHIFARMSDSELKSKTLRLVGEGKATIFRSGARHCRS